MSGGPVWVPEVEKARCARETLHQYGNVLAKKKIETFYMRKFQNDKF